MRVASWSAVIAPTRSLISSGCFSRYAVPRASSSVSVRTQSSVSTPCGSMTMTRVSSGSSARFSRALASCAASSAMSTLLAESERMNADSSALVCGYTVVVAAPAQRMPRSARIHSTRVEEASATRCSGSTPSSIRPAATA